MHVEATQHIHRALQMIKAKGVKAEVVINPGTPVSLIKPILYMIDQVLVMTVNPGFGGQKFIPETIGKIKQLDRLRNEHDNYNYDIEIDGGVNNKTVVKAYEAGANVAVAGSYVFDAEDPAARINAIREATNF